MAQHFAKRVQVEAWQWQPGKEVVGVVEETKIAKGGEPEVTHGLTLLPGMTPIQLKEKAKVGDTISAGRGHIDLPNGNTDVVLPGEWVVRSASGVEVLTDAEFKEKYDAA